MYFDIRGQYFQVYYCLHNGKSLHSFLSIYVKTWVLYWNVISILNILWVYIGSGMLFEVGCTNVLILVMVPKISLFKGGIEIYNVWTSKFMVQKTDTHQSNTFLYPRWLGRCHLRNGYNLKFCAFAKFVISHKHFIIIEDGNKEQQRIKGQKSNYMNQLLKYWLSWLKYTF